MTRVVVVGLGPAGADLVVPRARAELDRVAVRYARTDRHPAVTDLEAAGVTFTAFDDVYDSADAIDDVYRRIVETLVDAASEHGEVLYAVPGNPVVAEHSVRLLQERAEAGEIALHVVPGVSFAELAWARVGVDPLCRRRASSTGGRSIRRRSRPGARCSSRRSTVRSSRPT